MSMSEPFVPSPSICPRCVSPLADYAEGVWRCPAGHGTAATIEGLRGRVPDGALLALERMLDTGQTLHRPCPRCRGRMVHGRVRGQVEVDGCPSCRLFWFDPGEMQDTRYGPRPRPILGGDDLYWTGFWLDDGVDAKGTPPPQHPFVPRPDE